MMRYSTLPMLLNLDHRTGSRKNFGSFLSRMGRGRQLDLSTLEMREGTSKDLHTKVAHIRPALHKF